ncbi:RnfABCDGE type electron transport complex subunit A [Clostridiaceae bacterium NSJ-31]|uniref:Ion-translocating oxidoreductase complex subunit A n=1 Tax=Ligaoa zhengdingensis TaxID=2763658 RepID=A0A926E087_9FIRM|nr:RnfABCDGE type electron transport complex subunit A [Ligaoa zhengdingensis]MBC8546772.1 RnfABCDGE type electron transport complex subunit A [Ligaoa zhengdingensis]
MELARELSIVLFSAILVDNFVLTRFMGICPFLGVSKKVGPAFGMSCAVIFVMVAATAVTYPIYTYLLEPNGLAYLDTLTFILVIAAFVQLVELVLGRFLPSLHRTLGIYLPLITTNCAVLGVTLLNIQEGYGYLTALAHALGAGLGFLLAMLLFAGVRIRLENSRVLEAFQGLPITLISASIVALSFLGFGGVVDGIFR